MNDFTFLAWIIVALVVAGLWLTAVQSRRNKRDSTERRSNGGGDSGAGLGLDGSAHRSKHQDGNGDTRKGWRDNFTDGDFDGGGGDTGDGGGGGGGE